MPCLAKDEWKGLWAILWRVLLIAPVFWLLGSAWLLVVMTAYIAAPVYAALAFFAGDWFLGAGALAVWVVVLRFRRPILRWTLKGIEYAGI